MLDRLFIVVGALLIDRILGDPPWLWRSIKHPIEWLGNFIAFLDKRLNKGGATARLITGATALMIIVFLSVVLGLFVTRSMNLIPVVGSFAQIAVGSIFLAQKSLYDHVVKVLASLSTSEITQARQDVAMIVGRETDDLDQSGVSRAAIESLAENFSDGVVAPLFWFLVFGLPGLLAYKAINTADSMIGYENSRYKQFGFAAAKVDDLVNIIPARLASIVLVAATYLFSGSKNASRALKTIKDDARLHRSPNAGWPEAAFAGALNIRLAGPRAYGKLLIREPYVNSDGRDAETNDIRDALLLYINALDLITFALFFALCAAWAVVS